MRNRLLVFRGLAHDPQGVLTAVYGLALVGIERGSNFPLRFIQRWLAGFELRIASFADTEGREAALYQSESTVCHVQSLAHPAGRA